MTKTRVLPTDQLIRQEFASIIGLPCWGAKRTVGSMIMLEFGPVLQPPRPKFTWKQEVAANPGVDIPLRMTSPGGEWNFSFQSAIWTITAGGLNAATATSYTSEINQAVENLNGQTLAAVNWTPGDTLLATFIEGARMEACCDRSRPDALMWWLLQVNGVEVSMDGTGLLEIETPD